MSHNNTSVKLRERDSAVHALQMAMDQGNVGLAYIPGLLKRIIREEAWRVRIVKQTGETVMFSRFVDFLRADFPEGLKTEPRMLQRLCADDPEALDLLDSATVGKHGGDRKSEEAIKVNNVNLDNAPKAEKGNTRQYALRRLRTQRSDLHAKVLRKELSTYAAMKEAGFVKMATPLDMLTRAWAKASPEERRKFRAMIDQEGGKEAA
jgi:hypothetical protein